MIYLDNNATTPIDPRVLEEMLPYLKEEYGNPSSKFYSLAENAGKAVNNSREQIAKLINSKPEEIIFTSSASESNNFIIKGIADYLKNYEEKGNHLITTKVEHESIINSFKFLNGDIYMNKVRKKFRNKGIKKIDRGYKVDYLNTNEKGLIDLDNLNNLINSKTILVSIIWANNELGNINDIKSISKLLNDKEVFFHSDGTQGVGKIPINVKKLGLDALSFSSHKMYGPKGIGALYLKKNKYAMPDITSLIHGGDNQEFGYRAGTLAVHNIVGFGKAAEIARLEQEEMVKHLKNLEVKFIKILKEKYPDVIIISKGGIPGVISYILPDINNMLHIKNISDKIAISSGSACSITGDARILESIGLEKYKNNFFRVSFNKFIKEEDLKIIRKYI